MGSLMSSPSAPPMPAPEPLPDYGAEDKQARLDAMDRRRRGRAGTVTTSDRGLVRQNANATQKKTLLGE